MPWPTQLKFLWPRRSTETAAAQMASDSRCRLVAPMRGTGRPRIRRAPGTGRTIRDSNPGRRSAGRSRPARRPAPDRAGEARLPAGRCSVRRNRARSLARPSMSSQPCAARPNPQSERRADGGRRGPRSRNDKETKLTAAAPHPAPTRAVQAPCAFSTTLTSSAACELDL